MCPGDMDAPTVAKFALSHKQKQKRHFNDQRAKPRDDMDHFET